MRAPAVLVLAAVACLSLATCGGGDPGVDCPNDTPATCPAPVPSYAGQVSDIIKSRCAVCHSPSGLEPSRLMQTYAQIYAQRSSMLSQIASCRMPLGGATSLSIEERQALLGWFVCNAPNN
jgi:uncharacterized membrane protein